MYCSLFLGIEHRFLLLFTPHCRVGQRGAGLSATIARSEHEISEIIDGLSEQEVRLLSVLCYMTMQMKGLFQAACFVLLLEEKHFGVLVWESLCKRWLKTDLRNTSLLRTVFPNCAHPRFFSFVCSFQTCYNPLFSQLWETGEKLSVLKPCTISVFCSDTLSPFPVADCVNVTVPMNNF